jgi:signal transduction histidine kinase
VSGSILLSTVSNFLDFFKMEAGKQLDIVRTQVDLAGLVSDVHCIIEAMIGRSDEVALCEPDLDGVTATVMCDPDRLRGVLLNLYTNAAKFTKQVGGAAAWQQVVENAGGGCVVPCCADDGSLPPAPASSAMSLHAASSGARAVACG